MARILMVTHEVPGPAVPRAFLDARGIVGHEVITQQVAFIGRAPQRTAPWLHRQTHAVADATGEDLARFVGGTHIPDQHVGTVLLVAPRLTQPVCALPRL